MNNYDLIKNAILNKQQVKATYNGYVRLMCPHAIGTKNGREQALFYQFGGDSSQGKVIHLTEKNWRCVPVAGLSNIVVTNGDWHTFGNHSAPNNCIDIIDVEVDY